MSHKNLVRHVPVRGNLYVRTHLVDFSQPIIFLPRSEYTSLQRMKKELYIMHTTQNV